MPVTNITFDRRVLLETIVDLLLGNEFGGDCLLDEYFVAKWSAQMPTDEDGYYALPADEWIRHAIEAYDAAIFRRGNPYKPASPNELPFMREYLVSQLSSRLRRYARGRRLVVKEFPNGIYGFRWENYQW